jgi:hypothetical protein
MTTIDTIKNTYLKTTDDQFLDKWCGSTFDFLDTKLKDSTITLNLTIKHNHIFNENENKYNYNNDLYEQICNLRNFYYLLSQQLYDDDDDDAESIYFIITNERFTETTYLDPSQITNWLKYNVKLVIDLNNKLKTEKTKYNDGNFILFLSTMFSIFSYFQFKLNYEISEKSNNRDKDEILIKTNYDNFKRLLDDETFEDTENMEKLDDIESNLENITNTSKKINKLRENIIENEKKIEQLRIEKRKKLVFLLISVILIIYYYIFNENLYMNINVIIISFILLIYLHYTIEHFGANDDLTNLRTSINDYLDGIKNNSFMKESIYKDINMERDKYRKNWNFYERKNQKTKEIINDLLRLNYIIYGLINSILYILIMIIIIDYMNLKQSKIIKIGSSIIILIIFIMLYSIKNNREFYKKDFVKPM